MIKSKQLPKNWYESSLEDLVINISAGGTPRRNNSEYWNNGTIPWLKISDLHQGIVKKSEEFITPKAVTESSTKIFPKGTVLISIFASLGEVALLDIPAATNQAIVGIQVDESRIDKKYLMYYLNYIKSHIDSKAQTGTQRNINLGILKKIPIRYSDLDTQKKIVLILDQIVHLRQKRQSTIKLTKKLLNAIFFNMFGNPIENPMKWKLLSLDETSHKIVDGTHKTPTYVNSGIPFLTIRNIVSGYFNLNNIRYINEDEHKKLCRRCKPEKNDILYTKDGTLGIAKVIDQDLDFSIFVTLALIKIKKEILDPIYLENLLNLEIMRKMVLRSTKGIAIRHLHLEDIKKVMIPVPPLSLQKKFSTKVETIKNFERKIITEKFDILYNSLATKAFLGELVK